MKPSDSDASVEGVQAGLVMSSCDRSQYLFSIVFLVCLKLTVFNPYYVTCKI